MIRQASVSVFRTVGHDPPMGQEICLMSYDQHLNKVTPDRRIDKSASGKYCLGKLLFQLPASMMV